MLSNKRGRNLAAGDVKSGGIKKKYGEALGIDDVVKIKNDIPRILSAFIITSGFRRSNGFQSPVRSQFPGTSIIM